MTNAVHREKSYAGNPHVRFDEQEVASYPPTVGRPEGVATRGAKPRRGSLLYNRRLAMLAAVAASAVGAAPLLGVAGSCIISGETNRVERTVVAKPMTGSLAFLALLVVTSSPLEGVAFRGCEKRRWRVGFSTMKKTGKVQFF